MSYSSCVPFTKNKERIQKFKEAGDSRYIYQNQLDKAYSQHDMVYGDLKDLISGTTSDKILHDIIKNTKYDGNQRDHASMVYTFFDVNISGSGIKNENVCNNKIPEELHKRIIRKINKRKVQSLFMDSIWGCSSW